jgi:hypothetical protein
MDTESTQKIWMFSLDDEPELLRFRQCVSPYRKGMTLDRSLPFPLPHADHDLIRRRRQSV